MSDVSPPSPAPPTSGRWWTLASLLVLAGAVAYVLSVYDTVADPFASHWNIRGEADRFREKTVANVLFQILLGPVIVLLAMGGSMAFIGHELRNVATSGPLPTASPVQAGGAGGPEMKLRRKELTYRLLVKHLGWYQFLLVVLTAVPAAWEFRPGSDGRTFGGGAFLWAIGAVTVVLVAVMARGQRHIDEVAPSDQYDRSKLKLGFIYWDPDDPRVLIQSGSDFHMFVNLARPGAWGGALLVLLPSLTVALIAILAG